MAKGIQRNIGCPQKNGLSVKRAHEGIRRGLETKIQGISFPMSTQFSKENSREKQGQTCLPLLKSVGHFLGEKHVFKTRFFGGHPVQLHCNQNHIK